MKRRLNAVAFTMASLALSTPVLAQQQLEWKQTLNTPKGLNMPQGVRADILGIELGETYAEVKPKLQKLMPDTPAQPKPEQSYADKLISETMGESGPWEGLRESERKISFRAPSGSIRGVLCG